MPNTDHQYTGPNIRVPKKGHIPGHPSTIFAQVKGTENKALNIPSFYVPWKHILKRSTKYRDFRAFFVILKTFDLFEKMWPELGPKMEKIKLIIERKLTQTLPTGRLRETLSKFPKILGIFPKKIFYEILRVKMKILKFIEYIIFNFFNIFLNFGNFKIIWYKISISGPKSHKKKSRLNHEKCKITPILIIIASDGNFRDNPPFVFYNRRRPSTYNIVYS